MVDRLEAAPDFGAARAPKQEADGGFDIHAAINFLWRRWKLIGGIAALALLIGALYLARATPLYTATAQLLLDPRKEKAVGQDAIISDVALDQPMIESQIAIINSSSLLRRVVEKERLIDDPEFGGAPTGAGGQGLLATVRAFLSGSNAADKDDKSQSCTTPEACGPTSAETAAITESLKHAVAVARAGQAYVLAVSATSADPAKAARLANAVADAYVVDKLDARFEAARRASSWLSDRLVELRQQLRESEEAVARFRADNNLPFGASAGATLNQEQLGQLNTRLVAARAETAEKKARLDTLQKIEARGGGVSSMPDAESAGALADLRRQAAELSRQEADLLARYSPNHPAVVNLRAQAADVQRALNSEMQRLAANIRNEYDLAKARQEAIEKTLREVTGQSDLDSSKVIALRELERTAAVNKSLFEDFLQRARITQEQSTFETRDARVITPALPPSVPTSPKKLLVLAAALVLGLIGGVGAAYMSEVLNAGFTTPRQLEDLLGLPVLASISKMEARDLLVDGAPLTISEYVLAKPLSRLSEAFRSLRSAIQMSDVDDPPKVVLFTSTEPDEGKTSVALGFAASAAQSGAKVLVIDADLRRPAASRHSMLHKQTGLVDVLVGDASLQSALSYNEKLKFWVLPAGGKTHNAPDLLGSARLKALIAELRKDFDLIVVDTPPTGLVVDPSIIAPVVDKVVFVVRWAWTARDAVQHALERLSGKNKVAGVVFSLVIDAQARKYGNHAYSRYLGGRDYQKYYAE
jgi:polysaccharide biosynthesis transport protein